MSIGILIVLLAWIGIVLASIQRHWIGVVGYAGFAVLCPTWNWRWGLPTWDYQKFIAAATILGWVAIGLRRQQLTREGKISLLAILSYLVLCFISAQSSINPAKTAIYMDITWKMLLMAAIGIWALDSPKRLQVLLWSLVACQGFNAFNINQLYYQHGINVNYFTWNFLDNNTYSISTLPIAAITLSIILATRHRIGLCVAGLIFILQMHQIMILQSRGTMLGALVLIGLAVLFMPKNVRTWSMLMFAIVAIGVLAGPSVVEEFSSSFEAKDNLDTSAESRYKLWSAGAAIMQDFPLLGVGPWGGEVLVPSYYEGFAGEQSRKALHNLFFEVGTGAGVPALACYLLFFALPWWYHLKLWRTKRQHMPEWMRTLNLATLCGIPGYWVASMFSSGALIESPYLLVVLAIATLAVEANLEADEDEDDGQSKHSSLEVGDSLEAHASKQFVLQAQL